MSTLTAHHVDEVASDCLFREEEITGGEPPDGALMVEGVVRTYGFHPGRVHQHAEEITEMLLELPSEFMQSGGGGWSFLNACLDKTGRQWGEHVHMETLFALGMAIGKVECMFPRSLWPSLPRKMPYYLIKDLPE